MIGSLSVSRGRRRAGPCSTNRGADRSLGAVIRPEIDFAGALTTLRRELGIETLLLEGGAGINGSFLAAGLVDELGSSSHPRSTTVPMRSGSSRRATG